MLSHSYFRQNPDAILKAVTRRLFVWILSLCVLITARQSEIAWMINISFLIINQSLYHCLLSTQYLTKTHTLYVHCFLNNSGCKLYTIHSLTTILLNPTKVQSTGSSLVHIITHAKSQDKNDKNIYYLNKKMC